MRATLIIAGFLLSMALMSYTPMKEKPLPKWFDSFVKVKVGKEYSALFAASAKQSDNFFAPYYESATYKTYYFSAVDALGRTNFFHLAIPKDSATNPNLLRPLVEVWPGLGQQGGANNVVANTLNYGVFREMIKKGWDGSVVVDGVTLWPIYLFVQPQGATSRIDFFIAARNSGLSTVSHIIDTNRVYNESVSAGGRAMLNLMDMAETRYSSPEWRDIYTAVAIASPAPRNNDMWEPDSARYYAARGGSMFIMTGKDDTQPPYMPEHVQPAMELGRPGSSKGLKWNLSDGFDGTTHCCWDTAYSQTRVHAVLGGRNVVDWLFLHTKEPYASADLEYIALPSGTTSVTLNGITNRHPGGWSGWGKVVSWTKLSGPSATINNASSDTTSVTLSGGSGTYVFQIKSKNGASGPEATYNVSVNVADYEPPTFSSIRYIDSFNRYWPGFQNQMLLKAKGQNSFLFMALRDEFTGTFKAWYISDSVKYLNGCKIVIDSLIRTAVRSNEQVGNLYAYQDTFYSWLNKNDNSDLMKEVQLYEGYLFSPVMAFLVEAKRRGVDPSWVDSRIRWMQTNIWTKWATRGIRRDGMSMRWHRMDNIRTHIASHFYVMAHALKFLSDVDSIKTQCDTIIKHYDTLLTRNLQPHSADSFAYTWHSTWDNVAGTHAKYDGTRVQDVSHGNHVVDAVVFAHKMGSTVWTRQRMVRFAATAKIIQKSDYTCWDKLDLTTDSERPGNWGNFQGGGWIQLAEFDPELYTFYRQQIKRNNTVTLGYNQRWPYRAHLAVVWAAQNPRPKISKLKIRR